MRLSCLLPLLSSLLLAGLALGSENPEKLNKGQSTDPCAQLAELYVLGDQSTSAKLAYECLTTVPFDSVTSLFILEQLRRFSQIYSAQTFFIDPPTPELKIRPVDLNGTLDEIEKKCSGDSGYPNDYSFQMELMKLFASYHDGHVAYAPDCATEFGFFHDNPLISVLDPSSNNILIFHCEPLTGAPIEEITTIEGKPVIKYLEDLAHSLPGTHFIDPDARWNELFMSRSPVMGLDRGLFALTPYFQGESFKMKTKSGKEMTVEWKAWIGKEPRYKDKKSYYEQVCLDQYYQEYNNTNGGNRVKGQSHDEGTGLQFKEKVNYEEVHPKREYKKDIIQDRKKAKREMDRRLIQRNIHEYQCNRARKAKRSKTSTYWETSDHRRSWTGQSEIYHSNGTPGEEEDEGEPSNTRTDDDGDHQSHPIPDLQPASVWPKIALKMPGNEQTLHLLSPSTAVWGIHAFADIDGVNTFSQLWQDFTDKAFSLLRQQNITHVIIDLSGNSGGYVSIGFDSLRQFFPKAQPYYGFDLRRSPLLDKLIEVSGTEDASHLSLHDSKTLDGKEFSSIEAFLGPVYKYNDYFTQMGRWDVGDTVAELNLAPPDHTEEYFKPDNLILLSDGMCGSTCAIFAEAMSNLGVKSIAYNGFPLPPSEKKMMQHVGGIKGSQVWSWNELMTGHVEKFIKDPSQYSYIPERLPYLHESNMNLRNSYESNQEKGQEGEQTDLPLEFIYQPSNAHFYMDEKMWGDRRQLWEKARSMAWDEGLGKNILPDVSFNTYKEKAEQGGNKSEADGGYGYSHYILLWFEGIKEELDLKDL